MKNGTVMIAWAGGEHAFCLSAIGHILGLQEACGVGVMHVLRRLETDTWHLQDVREPIRLGLIGGGLEAEAAMALVKLHVDLNPNGLAPSVLLAIRIIQAVIIGAPKDDPVGKTAAPEAATGQASTTRTAASGAPRSTASAPV